MKKIIVLIICLLGGSLLFAQENTFLGTGALSQSSSPRYAIQTIEINNPGIYSKPTIDMGSHVVHWDYQYIEVDKYGVYVEGYFSSTTDLGSFVPSVVGGHGTGAMLNIYLSWTDGTTYYYEVYTNSPGSGYVPTVLLSSSTGTNYDISTYISEDNELRIDYWDDYRTNLYTTAPTVSVSFGGATATAILEGIPANGQNTAVGYQALYNSTSSGNVAAGNKAGYELTTGKNNTFIGLHSGKGITTGSGNTIIGSSSSNLPANLSNSVLLADGNGNARMYFTPNGNALIGYSNIFTDNGYKLDINGNGRFTGNVVGKSWDAFVIDNNQLNKVISYNQDQIIQAPTSKVFMDLLSFNKKGYEINFETSNNKVDFVSAPVDMGFFSGKAGTAAQKHIIDGSGNKAVRWTWSGVMYCNARWLALDYGYTNGTYALILVEQSKDNVSWENVHQSTSYLSTSGLTNYHFLNYSGSNNFIRLTIVHQSGSFINLSGIRLLTFRNGNQGAAPEYAYPYTWNKDGWIGINKGIADPEYPLDVNGISRFSGGMILDNAPISSTSGFDVLTRNSSTGTIEKLAINLPTSGGFDLQSTTSRGSNTANNISINNSYPYLALKADSWTSSTYIQTGIDLTASTAGDYLAFMNPNGKGFNFKRGVTSDLLISPSGNVGVGVENPLEKLAVNGKIRAREVKVEPVNGWPDYVFADNYKPLSLAEVSAFVKQHRHLPEVPSAKEVEQNGLELGEMNKLLLKKIEELTLHLIEKEEQLMGQEKEIASLRSEFMELKKLVGKSFHFGQEKN